MQFTKLFISALAILLFTSTSVLDAQTYKQQLKSTEIINRMFEGKIKFNPKQTRRVTASQLQKEIQANNFIPTHLRDDVYKNLIPAVADIQDVRIIIAEATADCGEIRVYLISSIDADGNISKSVEIFIPPSNKCGKLIEALYPAIYADYFGGKNIKLVKSNRCTKLSDEITVCADVLFLTEDTGQDTVSLTNCSQNYDCSKYDEDDYIIVWWDLIMEKK